MSATLSIPNMFQQLFMTAATPSQPAEPTVKHAWCQMCGPAKTSCSTLCHLEKGRWVHVEGNPLAGNNGGREGRSLCAKGAVAMQALYNPNRLMYPLKRVGAKGEGAFVRCTWDEALAAIGAKLRETKAAYGPESYGVLSPQAYPVLSQMGRRFLNVHGSPNYLHSGICALQRAASRKATIGIAQTEAAQMDKSRLVVNWGANAENSKINQGGVSKMLAAKENGALLIDIRPMMDQMTAHADIWLPVRPGTDTALGLAFLHVIIGEDLYDHAFVEQWCEGFDQLAQHVKSFPPSWAAPITGIPEEDITRVARLLGTTKPLSITFGNGIGDQQSDGHAAVTCVCLISAITGNLGIAGGGGCPAPAGPPLIKTGKFDRLTERLPRSAQDQAEGWAAGMSALVAPETPRWWQKPAVWESGPNGAYFKTLMNIAEGGPRPIRFLLAQSTNPLSATRQPKKVVEALKRLEFFVVVDVCWNPSCAYADFVLPACTGYETSQQFAVKNRAAGTFIGINQKIHEPLAESVSDWDFYLRMACAAGYGDDFWQGDMDACLRQQMEPSGISLEQLRQAPQGIFVPRPEGAEAPAAKERNYSQLFSLIPGNKVQCANSWLGGKPNADGTGTLPHLPIYVGPPESPTNTPELARDYPLIFSDVHAYRLCNHGYYADLPALRAKQPRPWVRMNPTTAAAYGVAKGDWVEVESPHGRARFVVAPFEGMAPGLLMARRGWWQSCQPLGLPGYGCLDGGSDPNVLYDSSAEHFNAFHSSMAKQTLVRMRKITGPYPEAAAHTYPQPAACREAPAPAATAEGTRIVFNPDRCIKCWACELACKQWHGLSATQPAHRRVFERVQGTYPQFKRQFFSVPEASCDHCASLGVAADAAPHCITSCSTGALRLAAQDPQGVTHE